MSQTKMFNRQKGYTSWKTILCHFAQQNFIIGKDFHLFSVTYHDKILLQT